MAVREVGPWKTITGMRPTGGAVRGAQWAERERKSWQVPREGGRDGGQVLRPGRVPGWLGAGGTRYEGKVFPPVLVRAFAEVLEYVRGAALVLVDIPIGLANARQGKRMCLRLAHGNSNGTLAALTL